MTGQQKEKRKLLQMACGTDSVTINDFKHAQTPHKYYIVVQSNSNLRCMLRTWQTAQHDYFFYKSSSSTFKPTSGLSHHKSILEQPHRSVWPRNNIEIAGVDYDAVGR